MSICSGKAFAKFCCRTNVIRFVNLEKARSSFCNVQTRFKTKMPRPKIMEESDPHKDYYYRSNVKTGFYGYFLLGIPIGTCLLGIWQVKRLKWKVNLIEDLKERTSREPVDLLKNLEQLESMDYCTVKVKGKFLHEKEITIGPRGLILNGVPAGESNRNIIRISDVDKGYYVITPFKVADSDLTILVNRGWVPKNMKNPATRKEEQVQGVVNLIGIVRLNEKRMPFVPHNVPEKNQWFYRDLNAMAKYLGTDPIYIDAKAPTDFLSFPIGGQTKVNIRNEHLSYIITWFSLSGITSYLWYKQFIKRVPVW